MTDSPDGHQTHRMGRVVLELLPQPAYVHGHGRVVAERPAPHVAQEVLAREHRVGMGDEVVQQVELTRGHRYAYVGPRDHSRPWVDHDVAGADRTADRSRLSRTTQHRVDSQHELA